MAGELLPIGLRPKLVAEFYPPNAAEQFHRWQERNVSALEQVPAEALRVEYGRTGQGLYVKVRIAEEHLPPGPARA